MNKLLISCLLLSLPLNSLAQDVGYLDSKRFEMAKLTEGASIDGVLDEAIWQQATLVTDLHQMNPFEYAEPTQRTEIRIYYTEDALYVGARMWDDQAEDITAQVLKQNSTLFSDDWFFFQIDPFLDRRSGYRFATNPNGVRFEAIFKSPTEMESNWQGIWQGESTIDENGWVAEMRIPFQTLSFNPENSDWGINFSRSIQRNNERLTWYSRNRQQGPGASGITTGMTGIRQGVGLDVVPGLTLRRERLFGSGPTAGVDENFEPTLDLFYKVTPSLNAALTINTDFSAAEVDNRQVNLTRFSLFFPEKRDFFLRDSDIFEFGNIGTYGFSIRDGTGNSAIEGASQQNARPFFSRRIGLSGRGAPVDIEVGGKLSGRVGSFNVGSLLVSQEEDLLNGVNASEIFVGRAVKNIFSESQIGVMLTDGDPQSNLDSTLIGSDFRYRNSQLANGKTIEANAWVQKTDTEGKQGDDLAYSFSLSSPNNTGWRGSAVYNRVEQNFDPAVGFVSRTGIQDLAVSSGYIHRFGSGSYLRNIYLGAEGYRVDLLSTGQLSSEELGVRIGVFNQTNDKFFSKIARKREVLLNDFTIFRASDGSRSVVIPAGEYEYYEWRVFPNSANQRKFSSTMNFQIGEYYNGDRVQLGFDSTWRPTRQYEFGLNYNENSIKLPGGDFKVRLISMKANVAFNSRWSWSNFLQYDNVSENMGFNSRLNWIPEAGQQAFLVFNYGAQDIDKDNSFTSTNTNLSLKFTYTFRY
ncbi:MAG: carbohydrate binding family 9 domain-containing protein [Gammaproteobacteria bacterium]|jgi:hypothetical protein|nr:carbohydrate binding family 9 domain-containing protein [Gammaproteobacteria bacterium]